MNLKSATIEELYQLAVYEDCELELKYKAAAEMQRRVNG